MRQLHPSIRRASIAVLSGLLAALALLPIARHLLRRQANAPFLQPGSRSSPALAGAAGRAAPPPAEARPSALEVERPIFPRSAFRRRPIPADEVQRFFHQPPEFIEHDPHAYFRHRANLNLENTWASHPSGTLGIVTNSIGLREDGEPIAGRPDLRVLVTGDSHTDGVCKNAESFANLLESGLAASRPGSTVDVLNAAKGSYSFYNYLGVLERFLPLRPDVFVVAVYGGNDFAEALGLHHHFAGTPMDDPTRYWGQVEEALKHHRTSLPQCFLALKHFAYYPQAIDAALQAARDVTTEIQVTCLRRGVRLVVVYLPPVTDVDWGASAQGFAGVARALELGLEQLALTDRMADSYLEFLRQSGIDHLDLRPAFRAADEPLYWEEDDHLNLAGHRLAAQHLQPRVEEAYPAGAQRVRAAPGAELSRRSPDWLALASPGVGHNPAEESWMERLLEVESRSLTLRWPLAPGEAEALAPAREATEYDANAATRWKAGLELRRSDAAQGGDWVLRTNAIGLRRDGEPSASRPALRVLVTGDALVSWGFENAQAFPARLEERLAARLGQGRVECLDAATPGHGPYSQVGALERLADLAPDVVVAVVCGGDDFLEALRFYDHFHGLAPRDASRWSQELERARELAPEAPGDLLAALKLFQEQPLAARRGLQAALELAREMDRVCRQHGASLLVVYAPSALEVDPSRRAAWQPAFQALGLQQPGLRMIERLGASLVRSLGEEGIGSLDLTPILATLERGGFAAEHQLTAQAQQRIAEALDPRVEALRPAGAGRPGR